MLARLGRALVHVSGHLPQPCVLCGDPGDGTGLCDGCRADLPWQPQSHCPVCAQASFGHEICGRCQRQPPAFDATVAGFQYRFPVDGMVRRLKFHAGLHLAGVLASGLRSALHTHTRPGLMIAVPLSEVRLRARGFNPSAEIGRALAASLGVPLTLDLCHRLRDTPSQSGLSLKARRGNLRDAFRCARRLDGIDVAVVDDVMTSGATIDALARELKRMGARSVTAWIAARTPARRGFLSA